MVFLIIINCVLIVINILLLLALTANVIALNNNRYHWTSGIDVSKKEV